MQPILTTNRLILRPFHLTDAATVQQLGGDYRVAEPTANMPHPYPDGAAEQWIGSLASSFESRTSIVYAITLVDSGALAGAVSMLNISTQHSRAGLGYWIGFPYWSQGICTEAALALIQYANRTFGVTRFDGRCLAKNQGSARVMEKTGFLYEGRLVQHVNHRGSYEDILIYGLTLPERNNAGSAR